MSKPVTKTYAVGDQSIHAERAGEGLTLCGNWVSDVKPFSPAAVTCSDCQAAVWLIEGFAELGRAFEEAGVRVIRTSEVL